MSTPDIDLAIVGSGGGAFSAAIAARERDLRVVMIERGTIGGTCVNVGCIPSKALLAAAAARHHAATHALPGIATEAGPVDMRALIAGKDEIIGRLRQEKYLELADRYGIELIHGQATFSDGPALTVDGRTITAAHYLIATGSAPSDPGIPGLTESGYLTSTTAMDLRELPASIVVLGGSYVALEQAQLFAQLGTRVTVIARSRIARGEEPEIAGALRDALRADGITLQEQTDVSRVQREGATVTLASTAGEIQADHVLVATGRTPQTAGLNLAAVGVKIGARGEVLVDEHLRTTAPRIWAAGDVTGHPQFVYVAARHGASVVANAFDQEGRTVDYAALPRIMFTTPQLASAGLTEAQAHAQGLRTDTRVLDLAAVPRAIVSRRTQGLIKLVADAGTGRLLGVHLLADGAGDAILAAVYAVQARMTVAQIAASWNPYLTIGEAIHLAAQSFTRDPATLSCCA